MGRVVHFEIPYDDASRATKFYAEAFGWRIDDVPEMNYHLAYSNGVAEPPSEPGGINGGLLQRQEPVTQPVITVDVPDIDAALATVQRLGGTVLRDRLAVGDMGFSAYITDSEGNTIGLWQSVSSQPGD